MSLIKCSIDNFNSKIEENIFEKIMEKNFDMMKEALNNELNEIEKFPKEQVNFNDQDLDNLDKLIEFIIPQNLKSYQIAMNLLKKYS